MKHTLGKLRTRAEQEKVIRTEEGGEEQGKSVTRNGGRLRAIQLFEMSEARKSRSS